MKELRANFPYNSGNKTRLEECLSEKLAEVDCVACTLLTRGKIKTRPTCTFCKVDSEWYFEPIGKPFSDQTFNKYINYYHESHSNSEKQTSTPTLIKKVIKGDSTTFKTSVENEASVSELPTETPPSTRRITTVPSVSSIEIQSLATRRNEMTPKNRHLTTISTELRPGISTENTKYWVDFENAKTIGIVTGGISLILLVVAFVCGFLFFKKQKKKKYYKRPAVRIDEFWSQT